MYCCVANDHGGYMFMTALVIDNSLVVVRLMLFGVLDGDGNNEWLFHVVGG